MAITLEVKIYEVDDIDPPAKIEVMGLDRTLTTNNINQALQLVRNDIQRVLDGPPEKEDD